MTFYVINPQDLRLSSTGDVAAKLRFSAMKHVRHGYPPRCNLYQNGELYMVNTDVETYTFAKFFDGTATLSTYLNAGNLTEIDYFVSCGIPLVINRRSIDYTPYKRATLLHDPDCRKAHFPFLALALCSPTEVLAVHADAPLGHVQKALVERGVINAVMLACPRFHLVDGSNVLSTGRTPQLVFYTDTYKKEVVG